MAMSHAKTPLRIQIDPLHNTLRVNGSDPVRLGHKKAGLFLCVLVRAIAQHRAVPLQELEQHFLQADSQWQPDRTALRRVVEGVQAALAAVHGLDATRLVYAPRCKTVGPWRLRVRAGESWEIDDGRESVDQPQQSDAANVGADLVTRLALTVVPTHSAALLEVLTGFMVADDFARAGSFTDAAQVLQELVQASGLSLAAKAQARLRRVWCLRRAGLIAGAQSNLNEINLGLLRGYSPQVRADLAAECALAQARLSYEMNPVAASKTLDFEKLSASAHAARNPRLQWEMCNLKALTLRRRWQAQVLVVGAHKKAGQQSSEKGALSVQRAVQLARQCLEAFAEAFYHLISARDWYHIQAVAVNYANFLQQLAGHPDCAQVVPTFAQVVDWYRFGISLVERWDLVEDSAWDFIMLGNFWLSNEGVRTHVGADPTLWPSGRSPATRAFYLRGVELANAHGDERQKNMADDLLAQFLASTGRGEKMSQATGVQRSCSVSV